MNTKRNILIRVYLSFLFFVVIGILIVVQIAKIQYQEGDYWRSVSDSLTTKYITIEPIRGNIYSADEKLLVTSIPIYDVRIDFKTSLWQDEVYFQENIDLLAAKMSNLFQDENPYNYKHRIEKARSAQARYYLLKRSINHNQLTTLKTFPFFNQGRFKGGFITEQKSIRIYPFKLLAERTIGYKSKDPRVSPVGLEGAFDEHLSGKSGKRLMQKISGGNWIPINFENELDPEDGKDIITTIDVNIQDVTEHALYRVLAENTAEYGCAVVMEVKTGHIKAIANLKRSSTEDYSETYNYALGASAEPGSTFKLISAAILLENNCVKLGDIIDTRQGKVQFYDKTMKDSKPEGYGKISFIKAFEVSSNVAFSTLVNDHFKKNPQAFIDEIERMSINTPLNIGIPGEGQPYFKSPKSKHWSGTTLPWMSVGYELQMTPLQMLTFYNAIANEGKMVRPMLVKEVRDVDKTVVKYETDVINKSVVSKKTIELLKKMMEGVVERGTAQNIKSAHYKIAGKTGTALIASKGSYAKKEYQASFAGYFPADNPKYSCIVVVGNPGSGVIYGGYLAAPVFRQIADKIYVMEIENYINPDIQYHNETPMPIVRFGTRQDMIKLSSIFKIDMKVSPGNSEWVYLEPSGKMINLHNKNISQHLVPDVRGMVLSDAIYLLENQGLKVSAFGFGKVISQSPAPGSAINSTKEIRIILG